jgi:hypothetical protein
MKFAAIADVHGNCFALEAVLADIAAIGIKDVVNLGITSAARSNRGERLIC